MTEKSIIILILGLVLLSIISGFIYLVLLLPTKWLVKPNKLKVVRLSLSITLGSLIIWTFSLRNTTKNFENATIEKVENDYLVTITGKRQRMTHDLISALIDGYYLDTLKLYLPRSRGTIRAKEISTETGGYKVSGSLTINQEKMSIDFFYYGTKYRKMPFSWNGDYKLKKKVIK